MVENTIARLILAVLLYVKSTKNKEIFLRYLSLLISFWSFIFFYNFLKVYSTFPHNTRSPVSVMSAGLLKMLPPKIFLC